MMDHARVSSTQKFYSAPNPGTTNSSSSTRTQATEFAAPRPKPRRRQRQQEINPADLEALKAVATSPRDRALLLLLIQSGLRPGELTRLDRANIRVVTSTSEDGSDVTYGKGQVVAPRAINCRSFWFGPECLVALGDYLKADRANDDEPALFTTKRGTRISTRALHDILGGWCKLAGIEPVGAHRFRYTFGSTLMCFGANITDLCKLLGHAIPNRFLQWHFHESDESFSRRVTKLLLTIFKLG